MVSILGDVGLRAMGVGLRPPTVCSATKSNSSPWPKQSVIYVRIRPTASDATSDAKNTFKRVKGDLKTEHSRQGVGGGEAVNCGLPPHQPEKRTGHVRSP